MRCLYIIELKVLRLKGGTRGLESLLAGQGLELLSLGDKISEAYSELKVYFMIQITCIF